MNIRQTYLLTIAIIVSVISVYGQSSKPLLKINSMEVYTVPSGERFIPVNRMWNNNWHYIDATGNYFFLEDKIVMSKYKKKRPKIVDFVHFSGNTYAVGKVVVKSVEYFLLQEFNQHSRSLQGKLKKIVTNSLRGQNSHLLNSIKFINTPNNMALGVIYQHTNEEMAELGIFKYRFIGPDLKPIFRRSLKLPKEYQNVREGLVWGQDYELDVNAIRISDNGTLYMVCKWEKKGVESFRVHQFHKDKTIDKWWDVKLNTNDGHFPAMCSITPIDTNTFEVGLLVHQGQKRSKRLNSKMGVHRFNIVSDAIEFTSDDMASVDINAQIGFERYRLDLVSRGDVTYAILLKSGYTTGHNGEQITSEWVGSGLFAFGFDTTGKMKWECNLLDNRDLKGRVVNAKGEYSNINEESNGFVFPGVLLKTNNDLTLVRVDVKPEDNKYCYVVHTIDKEGEQQVEILKNTSPNASEILNSSGNLRNLPYAPILRHKKGNTYGLNVVWP